MPWSTPQLRDVRALVRDSIRASLPGADALVPNSVLRVLSDNQGALCHLTLQYVDWLALQLLPDTAETEWLDRHGDIWLVNADGTTGRKVAALASGSVTMTGIVGTVVPQGAQFVHNAISYETLEYITLAAASTPTPVFVRALDPGAAGNLEAGATMSLTSTVPGADGSATVVTMEGGTDVENDDDLRIRVLQRIRQPPQGGATHDYIRWTLAVGGVTRAWCAALEMGIGTVTVRFMMDELRAADDGFPTLVDIEAVRAYLDTVRPVAVKDLFVVAPIRQFIDIYISDLVPDTTATRAAIEQSLKAMLLALTAPGQTIFAVWKAQAIMDTADVISFELMKWTDDVMESPGHMGVLGDIVYDASGPIA
jgi:uncharacterized phage protein gp47/JayE